MLGLDKMQRRDVQRRLTGLGFDIKATGKFDEDTRAVITRWQAARGYPKTGYLNALQHKALPPRSSPPASRPSSDDVRRRAARFPPPQRWRRWRRPSLSSRRRRWPAPFFRMMGGMFR